MMSSRQLSTFKKEEAEAYAASTNYGVQKIEEVIQVPLVSINSLMQEHFPHGVDILSVDTEGYDLEIIKALDFSQYAPKILCAETLRFNDVGKEEKQQAISIMFSVRDTRSTLTPSSIQFLYARRLIAQR